MVRCMLKGKVYEIRFETKEMEVMQMDVEEAETMEAEEDAAAAGEKEEDKDKDKDPMAVDEGDSALFGVVKCMMNDVIYYPGMDNVVEAEALREVGAAYRNTKIIEDHFDDFGRPRVKIVYVDTGDLTSRRPKSNYEMGDHIDTIIKLEKEKEEREGMPRPRLIFVKQDRDYWPGSEKDPEAMARRAAKKLRASRFCPWITPDEKFIWVPPMPVEKELDCGRRSFLRYFDPRLPGTKFIFDNSSKIEQDEAIIRLMEDPDLWKEWIRISEPAEKADAI